MSGIIFKCLFLMLVLFANTASAVASENNTTDAKVLWERVELQEASAVISGLTLSETMTWLFLLTGVLSSALAGFIIVRSQKRMVVPADEYVIIEDIIESADD